MSIRPLKSVHVLRLVSTVLILAVGGAMASAGQPRNVILMVGDGMGPEQIRAAGAFVNGKEGSLFLETLPRQGQVVTCPAFYVTASTPATAPAKVTDSAAAATAFAAGRKVFNGVISVALPGDEKPLPTVLEAFAAAGKGTGLVTSSYLTDATPAAFASHVKLRSMSKEIAADFLRIKPNLLLGGGVKGALSADDAKSAGYSVVTDRDGLNALKPSAGQHVIGLFGLGAMCYEYDYAQGTKKDYDTLPHLSEMAATAIEMLSAEPKGFFLMIEGGCIDKACHKNLLEQAIGETIEFDKSVKLVADWVSKRDDTLLIVVADHETGGLKFVKNSGAGKMPEVTWTSTSHSGVNVRIFAAGAGSEKVSGTIDNTDVYRLMMGTFTSPTSYRPQVATSPADAEPAVKGD